MDLDVGRYQGGWGRIKNMNDQLIQHCPEKQLDADYANIPKWNDEEHKVRDYQNHLDELEKRSVFFSYPLDLDLAMLHCFPDAFEMEEVNKVEPEVGDIKAVLGKTRTDASEYGEDERKLFITYHKLFKLGSKPAAHIGALSSLTGEELLANMPASLARLADAVSAKLAELPE